MAFRRGNRLSFLSRGASWRRGRTKQKKNRNARRALNLEALEPRQLLAVGPQLVGVQPNVGEVLRGGDIRNIAPNDLTFRFDEGQQIDPDSLDAIEIVRSVDGVFGNGDDIVIEPGFKGIGNFPNEVVVRFQETLPDDQYQITIFGTGPVQLMNIQGHVFNDPDTDTAPDSGPDRILQFELDLGAQIVAVVPQPVTRGGGALQQADDQIVVYFNDDDLDINSAENVEFYQLIFTGHANQFNAGFDTATNTDDLVFNPTSVDYDPNTDQAVLSFAQPIHQLAGEGTYRLRVGTSEDLPSTPLQIAGGEPGASFGDARNLGLLGEQSQVISAGIEPQFFPLTLPGSSDEPGHRDIRLPNDQHLFGGADLSPGTSTFSYNFQRIYGADPQGNPLFNQISPAQKDRVREIFELYSYYAGLQFVETPNSGLTIATGDLRAVDPIVETGPGGVTGIAGLGLAVMDASENWNNQFGAGGTGLSYFSVAMHEIGHLLGQGHTYDLPPLTVMGDDPSIAFSSGSEPIFPGPHDITHLRHLHRPDSIDVDMYRFQIDEAGVLSAETFAERLSEDGVSNSSLLDSTISLYRQSADGTFELIARNDDYFGEDAFVEIEVTPGTYFVGIAASGNNVFDPIENSTAFGGTSTGSYDLRLNFRPQVDNFLFDEFEIDDEDRTKVAFDGDNDGVPGGVFDFWFRAQSAANTLFVDKAVPASGDGSAAMPFKTIKQAFAAAAPGDIVRIVGNGGDDGQIETTADNFAYEVGRGALNAPLVDGVSMKVPRGVTVMVDAGVIFKMGQVPIEVGSTAEGIDRSGGALQVLGIPGEQVIFTSVNDDTIGGVSNPLDTPAEPGNWGGILFRNDLDRANGRFDYEAQAIFLNHVTQAQMLYGGGQVFIDSVLQTVSPLEMSDARPTIANNSIMLSADAAIAATPNSFEETNFHSPRFQSTPFTSDILRVGPDVTGNSVTANTFNALFVRIETPAGDNLREMTVPGRFNDTQIVHLVAENLKIAGTPSGPLQNKFTGQIEARPDGRLLVDPSVIVKMQGSLIETELGAQFLAEGLDGRNVVITSAFDNEFGAAGTFETIGANQRDPVPGDWGGIFIGHASSGSFDFARVRFGGGIVRLEGENVAFNAVEIHESTARVAHTRFENNASGTGGTGPANRFGRGPNAGGTIFVREAQPIIWRNTFVDNDAASINVNVNALNHEIVKDFGRSTGQIDRFLGFQDNQGPLVRGNLQENNDINGMVVRGATLLTQVVFDDTDIVHVVQDEIGVPDFHTFGGLRIESSAAESLVVKLDGSTAGFTANGRPLEIEDRIGGAVNVVGQPGFPVVLTSLNDDTTGAGLKPDGSPQLDTNNDGNASQPQPGDWRSIRLQRFSHDRNVEVITELEANNLAAPGTNGTVQDARLIGRLATDERNSDENLRLGFEIHGFINEPADVDVFSFTATAGTEVWFDIDRTDQNLNTVVELIRDGQIVARSTNSLDEGGDPSLFQTILPGNIAMPMQKAPPFQGRDFWGTNPEDAGMRLELPGPEGVVNTYFVRVRSFSDDLSDLGAGRTSGVYQMQIRLQEKDEIPGSTVRFADIRYAVNGVELEGLPTHSPLAGESAEVDSEANQVFAGAQELGNLLNKDRSSTSTAGFLDDFDDIDWYRFEIRLDAIQGTNLETPFSPTIFEADFADGLARPDLAFAVFDTGGNLIMYSRDSNVQDDRPGAFDSGGTFDAGSPGALDPFIGSVEMPDGEYFLAVMAENNATPVDLTQFSSASSPSPFTRFEPIPGVRRIVEDHLLDSIITTAEPPQVSTILDDSSIVPFNLADVGLFVSSGGNNTGITKVNPLTGAIEANVGGFGSSVGDLALRPGGQLATIADGNTIGSFLLVDAGNGSTTVAGDTGLQTFEIEDGNVVPANDGLNFNAVTFRQVGNNVQMFGIANRDNLGALGVEQTQNILFQLDPNTGQALTFPAGNFRTGNDRVNGGGTAVFERGLLDTLVDINANNTNVLLIDGDVADGDQIVVDTPLSGQNTFFMNTGPQMDVVTDPVNNLFIQDGDTFTLSVDDGTGNVENVTVEFDTGTVIEVTAVLGVQISEGGAFLIDVDLDGDGAVDPLLERIRFEFDRDGTLVDPSSFPITFNTGMNTNQLVSAIVGAINGVTGLGVQAAAHPGGNGRITLDGDLGVGPAAGPISGVNFIGGEGVGANNLEVDVEETFASLQIRDEILAALDGSGVPGTVGGAQGVLAGFDANRLNFIGGPNSGATVLEIIDVDTNSNNILRPVANVDGFPPTGPMQFQIDFLLQNNDRQLRDRIIAAINQELGAGTAETRGQSNAIFLDQNAGLNSFSGATSQPPFLLVGEAPGGNLTGMSFIGGRLFAVADTGALFEIVGPGGGGAFNANSTQATLDFIDQINDEFGAPIAFSGVTLGPQNVQDGAFSEMLFGISSSGNLYAFDENAVLQPIFANAETSMPSGVGGADGVAFSNLDFNLWHFTTARGSDPGHGVAPSFDGRVTFTGGELFDGSNGVEGRTSLYFGTEANNVPVDFDFPGGAHGSVESNTFSLEGIDPTDRPVLYFNYRLETENAQALLSTPPVMRDAFRVSISGPDGVWSPLTTNNSARGADDEFSFGAIAETFDVNDNGAPETWRQVRIPLEGWAGLPDLKLRFDFSTQGTLKIGDVERGGVELRGVPGTEIADGDTFTIGGNTFEFDRGFTIITGTGASHAPGESFTLGDTGGSFPNTTFTFVSSNPVGNQILITPTDSPATVAGRIAAAIAGAGLGVTPHVHENTVNLQGPTTLTLNAANLSGSTVVGSPGASATSIVVHAGMSDLDVVDAMVPVLANVLNAPGQGANTGVIFTHQEIIKIYGNDVSSPGPLGLTNVLPGDQFGAIHNPAAMNDPAALAGQLNAFEGVFVDDIIIGMVERGELTTGTSGDTTINVSAPGMFDTHIVSGHYQLEIRRGTEHGMSLEPLPPLTNPSILLTRSFDTNDRQTEAVTINAPYGFQVGDGMQFTVFDGIRTLHFEYVDLAVRSDTFNSNIAIPFQIDDTGEQIASRIEQAINDAFETARFRVTARHEPGTHRIDLFGPVVVTPLDFEAIDVVQFFDRGDENVFRDQGQILIHSNTVSFSEQFGISSTAGPRDAEGALPHQGPVRNLIGLNLEELLPGVVIANNVLSFNGEGGVEFAGDNAAGPAAGIPFGRIFNNTIYGGNQPPAAVDVVFLVDRSTTMASVIDDIQQGIAAFDNSLTNINVNGAPLSLQPQYGLVAFVGDDDQDTVLLDGAGQPTAGVPGAEVLQNLAGFNNFTNGPLSQLDVNLLTGDVTEEEEGSLAVLEALNQFNPQTSLNFRPDASKLFVLVSNSGAAADNDEVPPVGDNSEPNEVAAALAQIAQQGVTFSFIGDPGVDDYDPHVAQGNGIRGDLAALAANPSAFLGQFANDLVADVFDFRSGIVVRDNASPTLMNNILANVNVGINVDASSSTTVVTGSLFAGFSDPANRGTIGDFAITLDPNDPLFVDPANGNFVPAEGSQAIDSSVDSLQDRFDLLNTVKGPMGIGPSPIVAPARDVLGQLRGDDPNVSPPPGVGNNVFKDRGAIDRIDFEGPTAVLVTPRDNDSEGVDLNPAETIVTLPANEVLSAFEIQLIDAQDPTDTLDGVGVDDLTVQSTDVTITQNGTPLQEGIDYTFDYNPSNNTITLIPLEGVWEPGANYVITLINTGVEAIADKAGNPLQANQLSGATQFSILFGTVTFDFGDLPDSYGTLLESGGPRHVDAGPLLGDARDNEPDGIPTPDATGDGPDDDGVQVSALNPGLTSQVVVDVSDGDGQLDAWVDFNDNGTFETGEQIFVSEPVVEGANVLFFSVPDTAPLGMTFARFRLSSAGGLGPGGFAADGEVEDYQVEIADPIVDFGDAPDSYNTLLGSDGARHQTGNNPVLFLGQDVDAETDAIPSPDADTDNFDDGVTIGDLPINSTVNITVEASQSGRLDAWIDYNINGQFEPQEKLFGGASRSVTAGSNTIPVSIPLANIRPGDTIARFRLSSAGALGPDGFAFDGEVEDYLVTITGSPWQNPAGPEVIGEDIDGNEVIIRGDVDDDGSVTSVDVAIVSQELSDRIDSGVPLPVPATSELPPPFVDADGDLSLTLDDFSLVAGMFLGTLPDQSGILPQATVTPVITDTSGIPINTINVGETFQVRVFGSDDRPVGNGGVLSAFVDLNYNVAGAMLTPGSVQFPAIHDELTNSDTSTPGLINDTGAATFQFSPPIGSVPSEIFRAEFTATSAGTFQFDTAEGGTPGTGDRRDFRLMNFFGVGDVIELDLRMFNNAVTYESASLTVLSGSAQVVDQHIFYNGSPFDGNDSAANAADDNAIATDKAALLPGALDQTATFANYTNFDDGITGIMLDAQGLANPGAITAADFQFRTGNDNMPGGWSPAPAPSSITVRQGAGTGGSDRITVTWPAGAIQNQWLEVQLLATSNTNLPAPHVHYWGNAVGESGNNPNNANVDLADVLAVRRMQTAGSVPITQPLDFNRDMFVNSGDSRVVQDQIGSGDPALQLITIAGATTAPVVAPVQADRSGSDTDARQLELLGLLSSSGDAAEQEQLDLLVQAQAVVAPQMADTPDARQAAISELFVDDGEDTGDEDDEVALLLGLAGAR